MTRRSPSRQRLARATLALLVACTPEASDSLPPTPEALRLPCDAPEAAPRPEGGPFTAARGPSPFGTGFVDGATLGALDDPGAPWPALSPSVVDLGQDLDAARFDLFIPEGYDGQEPYGLVVFISAGNDGGPPPGWGEVLEARRLIWVGGEGIGNDVNVDVRMGRSALAAWRAMELFHIDTSRVYASGSSGGARTAMVMSLQLPRLFPAALPLCGASWAEPVDQDYETQEPDGHYEYWGDAFYPDIEGQPFVEHVLGYGQRFALLTSFDDFREGDLFNIYHNGLVPRGVSARLLTREGQHCATDAAQLADALAFIEDLRFEVAAPEWLDLDGRFEPETATLRPEPGGAATLASASPLDWASAGGATLRVRLEPEGAAGALRIAVSPWDGAREAASYGDEDLDGIVLDVVDGALTFTFAGQPLATLPLADWDGASPLDLNLQLWSEELRLELGAHVEGETLAEGLRLLDDRRSLRLRFAEAGLDPGAWPHGATLVVQARGTPLRVTAGWRDARGLACAPE